MKKAKPLTHFVGSIEFSVSTPSDACQHILELSRCGEGRHVHLANAYTVALADRDKTYAALLATPALNFPDGKPISWASRIKNHEPRLHQVRGPQLFLDVFDRGRALGTKHFLLGSTPQVLERLESNLVRRFPGVEIVGVESPPFRSLTPSEYADQDARIRESGAQIVWVGLGTPKQDIEVARLANTVPAISIAIGAAFDFTAGTLKEAPHWMTKTGLEWLYRFGREPRRLWKRYVFGNLRFIKAAARSRPAR